MLFTDTDHCRPQTRDGHVRPSLPLKVDSHAYRQGTHANLTHGIRSLASKESAVNRRTDGYDSSSALSIISILVQVRQDCLHSSIQTYHPVSNGTLSSKTYDMPSGFTLCINWNLFIGVFSTLAHQMAPELYTNTSIRPYLFTASCTICSMFS